MILAFCLKINIYLFVERYEEINTPNISKEPLDTESIFTETISIGAAMGIKLDARVRALFLLFYCFWFQFSCSALDTITSTQFIKDSETIVSNGSLFKLGFFSPTDSTKRFVGIWFGNTSLSSVVWVANRNNPLNDTSGIMNISDDGNLQILNSKKVVIWSSNVSNAVSNTTAQLLDSGNLVLKDDSSGRIIWESFQHPSHAFLENMKLSVNSNTGEKQVLSSWKNPSDPSTGSFSAGIDPSKIPQIFIWDGSHPYYRTGPWNGQIFIGVAMESYADNGFKVDSDQGIVSVSFSFSDEVLSRHFVLTPNGTFEGINRQKDDWKVTWESKETECDVYGKCGVFGICNPKNSPICSCLRGYEPKSMEKWNRGNWTSGCVRKTPLQCEITNSSIEGGKIDGFFKVTTVKVPDFVEWLAGLENQCEDLCLKNCSCIAYSYYSGIGCMSWSHDLIDVQKFSGRGADLYIRVAGTELGKMVLLPLPRTKYSAKILVYILINFQSDI